MAEVPPACALPSRAAVERRILALSRRGNGVGLIGEAIDVERERLALRVLINGIGDRAAGAETLSPGCIGRIAEGR